MPHTVVSGDLLKSSARLSRQFSCTGRLTTSTRPSAQATCRGVLKIKHTSLTQTDNGRTKAVLPLSPGDPAAQTPLLLLSCTAHPQGRRELVLPEQLQNDPAGRPLPSSRSAAGTSNSTQADPAATSNEKLWSSLPQLTGQISLFKQLA